MCARSFLCEEAKIKQRTSLKKELCEIGEEAIWESQFPSFFLYTCMQKPSFAHRLQAAKMASSRTSAQNNGPRAQSNGFGSQAFHYSVKKVFHFWIFLPSTTYIHVLGFN